MPRGDTPRRTAERCKPAETRRHRAGGCINAQAPCRAPARAEPPADAASDATARHPKAPRPTAQQGRAEPAEPPAARRRAAGARPAPTAPERRLARRGRHMLRQQIAAAPEPKHDWTAPSPVLTLHGYLRVRGELMDTFWLGRREIADYTQDNTIPSDNKAARARIRSRASARSSIAATRSITARRPASSAQTRARIATAPAT